jgi:amino-acid N-acetyltransferase
MFSLRLAILADAQSIYDLITIYADQDILLSKSFQEIQDEIEVFMVAEEGGEIIACGLLKHAWGALAEIRSLVVSTDKQNQGIGKTLLKALLHEAAKRPIERVFVLTYAEAFFESLGFLKVDKDTLPEKVWSDCVYCKKLDDCHEVAMVYRMAEALK